MGGSSVGKDLILSTINKQYDIPICVSSTSRPMRIGETNMVEYDFITKDKFLSDYDKGKFVEYRVYETANGKWYYGLSKDSVDINITQIVIVDEQGYYALVKEYGQQNVLGIYLYAPERVKIDRALSREVRIDREFFKEFYRRMGDDLNAFSKCEKDQNVIKVENIILDNALADIVKILNYKELVS